MAAGGFEHERAGTSTRFAHDLAAEPASSHGSLGGGGIPSAADVLARRARSFRASSLVLRSLRLARGWTQREAAERAGMSDRLIRKAEAGKPIEFKSLVVLAGLYSTLAKPLRPHHLLAEPLDGRKRGRAEPEALVRRWFEEVWNQGRLETIEELIAPDCILRAEGAMLRGPAEIRRHTAAIRAAFTNFDLRLEQIAVQGDWIISRWFMAMAHIGDGLGTPPTSRRVTVHGSTWLRVEGGLFVEGWDYWERPQAADATRAHEKKHHAAQ